MTADLSEAACRGVDPELFFATSRYEADTVTALAICRNCTVREPCLDQAMAWEGSISGFSRHGVVGGLTGLQRSRLVFRGALLAPCGTAGAARRHRRHGEPIDEACADALAEYDKARKVRAA